MVQEVQQPITTTPENTLETIEAIGTSSRKIIIGRQTREKIYGETGVTLTYTVPYATYLTGTYIDLEGTAVASDEIGELDFRQIENGIRIPLQGNYSVALTVATGSPTGVTTTTRLQADGRDIYTYSTNQYSPRITNTVNLSLGKFSILTLHIDIEVTPSSFTTVFDTSMVIQKI